MTEESKCLSIASERLYEQACEWFLEFRLGKADVGLRKAFGSRLRGSPERIASYLEVVAIWNAPAAYDARKKWDSDEIIAQAAAAADDPSFVDEIVIGSVVRDPHPP